MISPSSSKASFRNRKPDNGVSSMKETLETILRSNLGIPILYNENKEKTRKWINSIERLRKEISEKRLYNMARESLKGKMLHWFNAWKGDTFKNLDELLNFLKSEFLNVKKNLELELWKILVEGPKDKDLVEMAYEIKSLNKQVNIPFKTIKSRFTEWFPSNAKNRILEVENCITLIEIHRDLRPNEVKMNFRNHNKSSYSRNHENKRDFLDNNKSLLLKCEILKDHGKIPSLMATGKGKYSAILDTGADISLISEEVVNAEEICHEGNKIRIKKAVGDFSTLGNVFMNFEFKNKVYKLKLHVVKDLQAQIIIRNDRIKLLKINIQEKMPIKVSL